MEKFTQEAGSLIVDRLILAIQENKQYLSDIDGAIGDGDHGINMNKGFTLCREALDKQPGDFTYSLKTLGKILMMKIGGSMGPLYGKFFLSMGKALEGVAEIGRDEFGQALKASLDSIHAISPAQVGDKTCLSRPTRLMARPWRTDSPLGRPSKPWMPPLSRAATAQWTWSPSSVDPAGSESAPGA